MIDRSAAIRDFLQSHGLNGARIHPMAGDASKRRYYRITPGSGPNRILMDAPEEMGCRPKEFAIIADALREAGLSAPEILGLDFQSGFLLVEDFGDELFSKVIAKDSNLESGLYASAVDVLLRTASLDVAGLPEYGAPEMADATTIAATHYGLGAEPTYHPEMLRLLLEIDRPLTVSLRDFHVENLVWLQDRTGVKSVGLLDFQDTCHSHPLYDLASLLRDARRVVGNETAKVCKQKFASATRIDYDTLANELRIIAVQRNVRILGVFAKLAEQQGRAEYIKFIPHVWDMLLEDLSTPRLSGLRDAILESLPPPDSNHLMRLASNG